MKQPVDVHYLQLTDGVVESSMVLLSSACWMLQISVSSFLINGAGSNNGPGFILYSVNMENSIQHFLILILHFWNKPNFTVMYYHQCVLLDLIHHGFIYYFAPMFTTVAGLSLFSLAISLGFRIQVSLASLKVLASQLFPF